MSEPVADRGAESSGIDPASLQAALLVLADAQALPAGHPDAVALQRATASLYKTVKVRRRAQRRASITAADAAVTAATATGAPGRIDDETEGRALSARFNGAPTAGTLQRARACYVCKQRYTEVDSFHHQLCPPCAAINRDRRHARTDLSGRRALLTGGRAKIGLYIALRLLRDGATTTITTRFPHDAARRFEQQPDSADWIARLHIAAIDLRDPGQVLALADEVAAQGPLDILINNAAQTVRRSATAYAPLHAGETMALGLASVGELGSIKRYGRTDAAHPQALALTSPEHLAAVVALDAAGLVPDEAASNSWSDHVQDVSPTELLEVQLCNSVAPFLLISRLRGALATSSARRTYVVNVSAMEGQFSRGYKGPGHPHTNMAKAALNMLTRTSAGEMLQRDGILMTAVDTGWITDERPHPTKMRLAAEGFHAPLDLVDGAARVYDPIVRGEAGEDLYGCFLKDFEVAAW